MEEKKYTGDIHISGTEEGYDNETQVATIVESDKVTVRREVSDVVVLTVESAAETQVVIEQDGKTLEPITINGKLNTINISQ